MMRRAFIPILLLTLACASSQKLAGRYGVVFSPELSQPAPGQSFSEQVTRALQERLGTVDRLDAPQTSAYDAIIVLRRGPAVVAPKGHPVTENAYGSYANLIEFDIVRGGQKVTSGVARLEPYQTRDEIERQKGEHLQPVQLSNVYEESRTIARAVVDAIKRTAS